MTLLHNSSFLLLPLLGVFLYIERFCDDVQQNHLSLDRPDQFPQGLGGIFCQWFQRQFPDLEKFRKDVRPALRAILAAREPLPVEILQRLFHWQDEELRDFTRTLGSLFPVTVERRCEVLKACHKSIPDWLADESKSGAFFVSFAEGNRLLADYCWRKYLDNPESLGLYEVRHVIQHLEAAGRTTDAARLRVDNAFQKRRLEIEIEASDAKYRSYVKFSADQADLKNEYEVLLNTMAQRKRWHPQPAELHKELGAQEDYCEVYRFPCCGKFVLVGDWATPSQYRADGCSESPEP